MLVEQADGGWRAVITDFGLAGFAVQEHDGVTGGSGFSGTLAYAAPERIAGGRATAASDVYSFGLVAVEMLTGGLPSAPGASVVPGALAALPEPWTRVLAKATNSDSQARLATGGAVAEALRALAGHAGRRSSARRPATVALMIATAIAAAVIVWLAGVGQRPVAVTAAPQVQAARAAPMPLSMPLPASPPAPPPTAASEEARPRARRATVRRLTRVAPAADAPPATRSEGAGLEPAHDELVRDLTFRATGEQPTSANASDAELADPFKRRRTEPVGVQP